MSSRAGPSAQPSTIRHHDHDSDLISLTARLTLDDIEEIESRQKGKGKAGTAMTDAELALRLSAEEARASIIFNNDRAIAQQLELQELDETQNVRRTTPLQARNAFLRQQPAPVAAHTDPSPGLSSGLLGSIFRWLFAEPLPSSEYASGRPIAPSSSRPTGHTCVCCQDPIHGVEVRGPCGHYYDKACITDLFEASTKDESLFPPRCCRQPIPVAAVLPHLTKTLATAFNEKGREFGTLKRVYCANQKCSHFLGPQYEGWFTSTIKCPVPNCSTVTCNGCKGKVEHSYHICKTDQGEKDVLALSKASGWARCPSCSQMIELALGCYHMTCLCKAEFCYLCQQKWKTCRCAQWDENRLVAAAEARVNAQLVARRPVPVQPVREGRAAPPPRPVPVQPIREWRTPPAPRPMPVQPVREARTVPPPHPVPVQPIREWRTPPTPRPMPEQPIPERRTPRAPVVSHQVLPLRLRAPAQPTQPTSQESAGYREGALERYFRDSSLAERTPLQASQPAIKLPSAPASSSTVHTTTPTKVLPLRLRAKLPSAPESSATEHTTTPVRDSVPATHRQVPSANIVINSDSHWEKLVREAIDELRVNHDCQHTKWSYRNGGGQCQTCYHKLPLYLYRCGGCQTLACNRCRRNRL